MGLDLVSGGVCGIVRDMLSNSDKSFSDAILLILRMKDVFDCVLATGIRQVSHFSCFYQIK